jgi:hypothetical protein
MSKSGPAKGLGRARRCQNFYGLAVSKRGRPQWPGWPALIVGSGNAGESCGCSATQGGRQCECRLGMWHGWRSMHGAGGDFARSDAGLKSVRLAGWLEAIKW